MLLRVKRLLRESQEQQKKAEAASERYRLLFERDLAGVLWTRPDGAIVDCNDALARLLGHGSRGTLVGLNVRDFYVKTEDRDALIAGLERQGAVNNRELYWRRRDGTDVWLRVNLRQRDDGVFEGILVDVSDGKRAEEAEHQAMELRAIAKLANAAAHEINNPLSVIIGYLTIIGRQREDARIDRALEAGGRIRDIISRMARVTRVEHFEQTSSSVPPIVDIRRSSE